MKRQWFLNSTLIVALALALVAGSSTELAGVLAQGPELSAGEAQTQGDLAIAAVVESKISYQGMLEESGQPVTGSRDMRFRLYSNSTCTTQVGSEIIKNSVQITAGLFSIELPVTQSDFNGQGLWVRTRVGATWIGCQEILPVPYALSLRPGAKIEGAPGLTGNLVGASTADSKVKGSLVQGMVLAAAGVYGFNSAIGFGVYGETQGDLGVAGVYGTSNHQNSAGGRFVNNAGGFAGYFEGDVGQSRAATGLVKAAVYAHCGNTGSTVYRHFNNVNSSAFTIVNGTGAGMCIIDLNFDLRDRFMVVSSYGALMHSAGCHIRPGTTDELTCLRWSTAGSGINGGIMILVY